MALGRRARERQDQLWLATDQIAKGPGSPFYARLNAVLARAGFDTWVEQRCSGFYAGHQNDGNKEEEGGGRCGCKSGRPGIPPGVYFRMLMIGYLEGINSERSIAWRCADSLSLREFLGYELTQGTPDHSTLSVIRGRIDGQTHQEVFDWILVQLARHGLLKGKTIGVDATTLEANAALRSLVRRDTGEGYSEFLEGLAKASGIATPTRADLARLDRKRAKKGSNEEWVNPHDPDAKIAPMKDGRTHLAHKAEHAVDLETGAIVAVTVQPADRGDTTSIAHTLCEVMENLDELNRQSRNSHSNGDNKNNDDDDDDDEHENDDDINNADVNTNAHDATSADDADRCRYEMKEVVTDKGYHSNDVARDLAEMGIRSYLSEPERGGRKWEGKQAERDAVYANRRRIRGRRGKQLLRKRGELLERPFAHCYETGGLRRTPLRGSPNILKRLLIHSGACNLGLLMRRLIGVGTPRAFHDLAQSVQKEAIRCSALPMQSKVCKIAGRSLQIIYFRFINAPPPSTLSTLPHIHRCATITPTPIAA